MDDQKLQWLNQEIIYRNGFASDHWSWNFVETGPNMFPGVTFWTNRTGTMENLPRISLSPDHLIPTKSNAVSWESATVDRINDLRLILESNDSAMIDIAWSGGIDSTFVVCAVLHWLPVQYRKRVRVGVSVASIGENPYFFRDILTPNFQLFDIQHAFLDAGHVLVTGGQGDKIMENEMMLRWACSNTGDQSLYPNINKLLDLLKEHVGTEHRAKKVLEMILGTAYNQKIKLETVGDALWWLGFNFGWIGMMFCRWARSVEHVIDPTEQDRLTFSWFASRQYQQWSMNQTKRFLDTKNFMFDYKKPAKDFINSVYPDRYYQVFKQKISSSTLIHNESRRVGDRLLLAISADGRKIYSSPKTLEHDLVQLDIGISPISS